MEKIEQTLMEMVNHLLVRHPQLAPQVEALAIQAQGRSLEDVRAFQEWRLFKGLDTQQVFTRIYQEGLWGRSGESGDAFFSGTGSRDEAVVAPYIQAVTGFLNSLPHKPDVVDLGCGDFKVGQRIRHHCQGYVACDIVPQLIEHHRAHLGALDVDFRHLDLTRDELPAGEVVFIRQVLQHLSNAQIAQALLKIAKTYRYLVLTEHLPGEDPFVPNLEKAAGRDIRMFYGSGVVLSAPPFNLQARQEQVLCEVPESGGRIRTTLYTLK